ncbi:MAG: alpha/beta hydrolase-fold protein [Saprospiraceae bacterium]
MKNLMPILLVLAFVSCQKEVFNPQQTSEFSIHSSANGADYTIKVALPQHYDPETNQYATIYVLDGDENFNFVAENSEKISTEYSTTNVLVVSIGYGNDRTVDYTPTSATEGKGQAEKFMQFIQDELIPKMETDYGVDTARESRIILGHSFGGLLAAYAFTNFNTVFGGYLMLSPSLWYDNEILLRYEQENRDINNNHHQLVYLGLGELEKGGRMLAPFEAFYHRLAFNYPGIKLERHLEPHLDHVGSKNPNILEGLHFYFENR